MVGRAGRWAVAGAMAMGAFAMATWVSGAFLFTWLLPSPDIRWPVAFGIGAAVAAFIGLWGQSWATESGDQGSRPVLAEQLTPDERRERKACDQLRQHLGRQDRLPPIEETSALALGVHPAIDRPQPPGSAAALGAEAGSRTGHRRRRFLPRPRRGRPYPERTLDQDLPAFVDRDKGPEIASWMRRAREDGGFLVLIGDSSVGKTRLLYETARDVLPHFAVLAPDLGDGGLVNSIAGGTFPLPKLIVWLDELQRFLDGPYLTPGSTPITATAVRHLLDAPTPVVVLGAMWLEHDTQLRATEPDPYTSGHRLRYPGAADILRDGRVRREMLTSFSGTEREAAAQLASNDPRLAEALADRDFNVTEVLTGAPRLVARYQQAPEEQRAVLNAAIDARRLGIQAPLTGTLLRAAARGYLSTLHPDDTWLSPALTELARRDRPQDHATAPLIPVLNEEKTEILGYTVADYLLQHASRERRYAHVPASAWDALITHVRDPADTVRLADSARRRLLYRYAIPLYRHAAVGDKHAAAGLVDLLARRGDVGELRARADADDRFAAERVADLLAERDDADGLRARADAGDRFAALRLAGLLAKRGELDEAEQILRARADADDWEAASWLAERGDTDGLRARADAGDMVAATWLAKMLAELGDEDELRARADAGDPAAAQRLPTLAVDLLFMRGDEDELRARADAGDGHASWNLAELFIARGDEDGLRARAEVGDGVAAARLPAMVGRHSDLELRARAEAGDKQAAAFLAPRLAERGDVDGLRALADADHADVVKLAEQLVGDLDELRRRVGAGDRSAAEALAYLLAKQGRGEEAERLRRFGLNLDGSTAWA